MDKSRNRIGDGAFDRGMSRVRDGLDRLQERAKDIMGD